MRLRSFLDRVISLLLDTDTKGARFVLMVASFFWTVLLLAPGNGFERSIYAPMNAMAPDWVWGLFFLIHFCSTLFSSFTSISCKPLLVLEGLLGLALYTASTMSAMLALDSAAPLFSPGIACTVAAFWVLVCYPGKEKHVYRNRNRQ